MKNFCLLSIVAGVLGFAHANADVIYVSGDVSGTWSADTVLVTGEICVPSGLTLTIEAGVKVLFQTYCKFIVDSNATLYALGTETDSILFDEFYPDTSWHGIRFLNASESSRLEYCHLTNGSATGVEEPDCWGGAVYCFSSDPTISNCLIDNGYAWSGGGILCYNSNPVIENCLLENCTSYYGGGIACCFNSSPNIKGNTITECGEDDYGVGGGIYCAENSNPEINDNTIIGNGAHMGGGGIYCYAASPTIIENTISDNWTCGLSAGGGIYCVGGFAFISDNLIENNFSGLGTGIHCQYSNATIHGNIISQVEFSGYVGISCHESVLEISNNLIMGGQIESGPGIQCYNSSPLITNNIISGFVGFEEGGIYCCNNSNPNIINTVIVDNIFSQSGGGVRCSGSSSPAIINCILWGNTPDQISHDATSQPTVTYSNVQNGWPGMGNIDDDPLFTAGPLSDYHLSPGSPCIDAGNPDPDYNDPEDPANPGYALWPALGTVSNDMGAYGGGGSEGWPGVEEQVKPTPIPNEFCLLQNYPNPFNSTTIIGFHLPVAGWVKLEVFDISGRNVGALREAPLLNGLLRAGTHHFTFDGSGLPSGIYFYRLTAGQQQAVGKMVLIK